MTKKIYAIGNAHLDPVWMWRWQEGSAEAKATIRSALDRMNEFPEFKFVCSSASVYKWIEEFDPAMFEEIKQRVKEGRFIIVGGWFVQPDCNIPSGEGFARQTLYSQRYFMKTFGVTAKVGYNVDSFGHNGMLPQILKKSGMDHYIFMRPNPSENPLEQNIFKWEAPDGSKVTTARIIDPYCFRFSKENILKMRISYLYKFIPKDFEEILLFYGVGNHGGGPTIKNIQTINEYNKTHNNEIEYANPLDFFKKIEEKGYPLTTWKDDLQHHASGCYSAVSMIKTLNRKSENALLEAETYSYIATNLISKKFPNQKIEEGFEDVCFNHFHDTMGGCAIKSSYEDAKAFGYEAIAISEKLTNNATQSLSWKVDTQDTKYGIPVIVFNPHPYQVTELIVINKQVPFVLDTSGNKIQTQNLFSETRSCKWRDDTSFIATVPAYGYTTYYIPKLSEFTEMIPVFEQFRHKVINKLTPRGKDDAKVYDNILENGILKVVFDPCSCQVISIQDKRNNKELLGGASEAVVIDETKHDTWSHGKNFFDSRIGAFKGKSFECLETGPLRATIKVVLTYGSSTLTEYFSLTKGEDRLVVNAKIDWHEKHKMLKLKYPTSVQNPQAFYEIPFGVIERPTDGEEEPMQTFFAIRSKDDNQGLSIINNNKYSGSIKDNVLYLTAVRSPLYGDHGGPRKSESIFTDQGEHDFGFAIRPIIQDGWHDTIQTARVFNTHLTNIIENNHKGSLPLTQSIIDVSANNIMISAIKRGEDGISNIVRAYETDGKDNTKVDIKISGLPTLTDTFSHYSMRTYRLEDGKQNWEEVLLSEYNF